MTELDAFWLEKGTEQIRRARSRTLADIDVEIDLESDFSTWSDVWVAAELLTFDQGTEWELGVSHIIDMPHALTVAPTGDVVELLEAAEAATGDARITALEAAWHACFAPALADVIEALDRDRKAPEMPVAKKKKDTVLWVEAAKTALPRSMFDGEWPKTWRDAQRRMRPLYARPRSPLFAAAAIELTKRDPLPYISIASSTYWQAHAWFIAEQGDVRQLAELEAFEKRMAPMWGERTLATDAPRIHAARAPGESAETRREARGAIEARDGGEAVARLEGRTGRRPSRWREVHPSRCGRQPVGAVGPPRRGDREASDRLDREDAARHARARDVVERHRARRP